jgi:hypothetical protein
VSEAFSALLGWWYAAESREFVPEAPVLRQTALALDALVEKVRSGRALTASLLAGSGEEISADAESLLTRAADEEWGAVRLAAELASLESSDLATRLATAVALMTTGVTSDALFLPLRAVTFGDALSALADEALATRRLLTVYLARHGEALLGADRMGRGAPTARALLELLVGVPAITIVGAAATLGVSVPTVGAAVERLERAQWLREITGRGRDRVFVYTPAEALAG